MTNIKDMFNFFYTIALIANACLYIPQAVKIYRNKSSKNLSITMFFGFSFYQFFAILNGIYYYDLPLIIGKISSFITCSVVIFLIFVYRKNRYEIKNRSEKIEEFC